MTIIVNLYGAPGSGKSTTRADVFRLLKFAGVNCEEVYETAKKFTWAHRHTELASQPYIFGKQLRDIEVLMNQVDVIITDSPLMMSYYYGKKYCGDTYPESFYTFVEEQFKKMGGMNYYINRVKPFNPKGRNQTEDGAAEISIEQKAMLTRLNIGFKEVNGDAKAGPTIFDDVMFKLGVQ